MAEYGFFIPSAGRTLIAGLLAGETLEISRVMVGSGKPESQEALATLEDLVAPVAQATSTTPLRNGEQVDMVVEYRSDLNGGLDTGFWLNEFGIFAMDGDEEVMFYYGTLGDFPQWVSAYNDGAIDVRRYPVSLKVSADVEVVISYPAMAFMTADDVEQFCMTTILPQFLVSAQGLIDQHNANAERAGVPPDGRTLPAGQVGVKAGGSGAPGGEADRLAAVVGVVLFRVLGAQAVRAVRDHQGGNAQAFHGFGVPEIRAGAKPGLFFQRELGNQFGNVVFHQKVILLLSTRCGWGARAGGGCSGSGNVPDTPFRPRCLRGVPKWTHTPIFCIIIHHFAREKIAFLLKNVKSENFFCAGCWCVWHCISPLFRVKFKIRIYSGKNVFWAVFQGGKNEKR